MDDSLQAAQGFTVGEYRSGEGLAVQPPLCVEHAAAKRGVHARRQALDFVIQPLGPGIRVINGDAARNQMAADFRLAASDAAGDQDGFHRRTLSMHSSTPGSTV